METGPLTDSQVLALLYFVLWCLAAILILSEWWVKDDE